MVIKVNLVVVHLTSLTMEETVSPFCNHSLSSTINKAPEIKELLTRAKDLLPPMKVTTRILASNHSPFLPLRAEMCQHM